MWCNMHRIQINILNLSMDLDMIFARGIQRNINIVTFVSNEIVAMQMGII